MLTSLFKMVYWLMLMHLYINCLMTHSGKPGNIYKILFVRQIF